MTNYEKLRFRINQLLPDRLRLEFGCEVLDEKGEIWRVWSHMNYRGVQHDVDTRIELVSDGLRGTNCMYEIGDTRIWKILGKPLTIVDVIRALIKFEGYSLLPSMFVTESQRLVLEDSGPQLLEFDLTMPLSAEENDNACAAMLKLLV